MALFIGGLKANADDACAQVESLFEPKILWPTARYVIQALVSLIAVRKFSSYEHLARRLKSVLKPGSLSIPLGARKNYYHHLRGENYNVHSVIFKSTVPTSSIGWTKTDFFNNLGDERNPKADEKLTSRQIVENIMMLGQEMKTAKGPTDAVALEKHQKIWVDTLKRRAEQEYLLQNMVKGALYEAAEIANRFKVGISVRGTGLLAHMGIESGNPTKAQEFKNKTSKEVDLLLCDELTWQNIGAVVHYDPRVEWTSWKAVPAARTGTCPLIPTEPTHMEWVRKKWYIKTFRIRELDRMYGSRVKLPSGDDDPYWDKIKGVFFSRAKEYLAEDRDYRPGGHYAVHCKLVGPYIRVEGRPNTNMVGDHDLFGFTLGDFGQLKHDSWGNLRLVQIALQEANTFQGQHGGIWNWKPREEFHQSIKIKIMGGHSPPDGEPLVYVLPGFKVCAAFYIPGDEILKSVWDCEGVEWLLSTHSGKLYFETPTNTAVVPFDFVYD